jgi:2-dehydro-3-deoxyphosphogluconate aldolase / (4S)-4-hydroxy-2-oxoglutarate aldolase
MATTSETFFERYLGAARVMVILRGFGPDRTVELCQRAWNVGVPLVEVPVQGERGLAALAAAASAGRDAGRLVGAGTVISAELVAESARAGASFTVAPGLDEGVVATSRELGLPHLPGVATATEVHQALRLGLVWQKAFPASVLGGGWIEAMHGPFPQARFVATGGVGAANAADFLRAGAAAVSLGSAFADMDEEDISALVGDELVG